MLLKNTVYGDVVLHNGTFSYQVPRDEVVEVPDRIGAKFLARFPDLEQVEVPATASCYLNSKPKTKAAPKVEEKKDAPPTFTAVEDPPPDHPYPDEDHGEEGEGVELMPGVKVQTKKAKKGGK